MKTNRILMIAVFSFCFSVLADSQNTIGKLDDLGRIALNTWVPDQIEYMPAASKSNLGNKLSQIATRYGMGASELLPRFIITANVVIQSKDITSTAPPMHALTVDITIYIGDGIEGKVFASTTVSGKGVGENETKAYTAALRSLDPANKNIQKFMEEGKRKIIAYYNSRCDIIIKEAQMLESQNRFDEAIYVLMCIPDVCLDCYNKAMDAIGPVFQNKIDWECKAKVNAARNVWSAGLNYNAANKAAGFLASIDPEAACFNDAVALTGEIAKRVKEIDGREWDFILKKEIGLERDRIKAWRDVGIAWGTHQPQNIVYKSLW
ncbi:MAG: hypothetical protein D4R64_04390 [Porphyromonadaceae bacterium]|nr:MAG: hypothetical protein D4R64_04390 [Porphyromonadaceae bacterium]